MRLAPLALIASVAALVSAQNLDKKAASVKKPTVFNGVSVPPLLELTPENFQSELAKSRFFMVKHYSPYCPHCIDFAPIYQTLYEFYYTSHPEDVPAAEFLEHYDFRFGMINCVAFYDLCVQNGVGSFPTTILYENGEALETLRGVKKIQTLAEVIEPVLEKAKPGSRPKDPEFPRPGDHEFPKAAAKEDGAEAETKKPQSDKPSKYDETYGDETQQNLDHAQLPAQNKNKNKESAKAAVETKDKVTKVDDTKSSAKEAVKSEDKPKQESGKYLTQDFKAPTAAEIYNEKKPKKPDMEPNQNGLSIALTPESFQRMVTMTSDPWFIKFYAPWCPHCQAMGPTWDQLAKNMQGKINIGEVNCDVEKRLCKEVGARSYPTVLFFKGGERSEYRGLRGLGDFVQYAEGALDLAGGVPDVDAVEFAELEKKEEVIFVYFYDHAATSEDFAALERIPLNLIGHAKLVKTNDPALFERFKIGTWPRLLVSRGGRPTYYNPLTPDAMRNVNGILDWMRSVWLPLVPELTASNARQIMDGKTVVLGVLKRENAEAFQSGLKELKAAANEWMDRQIQEFQLERKRLRDAKNMRVEEARDRGDERALNDAKGIRIDMNQSKRKEVGFAWVDGVFWQRWIRTTYGIDIGEGERVIINDQDARRYWDQTVTGNYIMVSRTAISESLDKIVYGPHIIPSKLTTNIVNKVAHDMAVAFVQHPVLSAGVALGLAVVGFMWFRGRARRARGSYFKLDEKMGGFKDGLLGAQNNNNAKAD